MTRFIFLMAVWGFSCIVSAAEKPNFDSLYHQLDKAIEQLDDLLAEQQEQIKSLKVQYIKAHDPMRRYLLAEDLFEAYRKLMNDSAYSFTE